MTQTKQPFANVTIVEGKKTEEFNWVEVTSIDQATHLSNPEWLENPPIKYEIESFTMKINKSGEKVLDSFDIKSGMGYTYPYYAKDTSDFKHYKFYKKEVIVKESPKKIKIEVDEETAYMLWALVGHCQESNLNTTNLYKEFTNKLGSRFDCAFDIKTFRTGYTFENKGSGESLNLVLKKHPNLCK